MNRIFNLKNNFTNFLFIIIGILLIVSSIGTYFVTNQIIEQKIKESFVIKPNSTLYEFFLVPPAKVYRKYYFFDIINTIEIQKGEKPILVERGPYVYREVWERRNIEFDGDELISFNPVITLLFEPHLSNGTEKDYITFLNIPAMSMLEQISNHDMSFNIVNGFLEYMETQLFIRRSIRDLLSGYQDPLIDLAKMTYPNLVQDDFSLTYGKNGTEMSRISLMTGYNDSSNFGKFFSFNGMRKLNYWESKNANMINGTDGILHPPFLTRDKKLYFFNSEACRSYSLTYLRDNEVNGIQTYDYHLSETIFYNSTINPDNEGFCSKNCLGNGVMNMSKCYGNLSFFMSQPHFLNAEEKFVQSVVGLRPDKNIHDFIFNFLPTLSVALKGSLKLQLNFFVQNNSEISIIKNVKPVLLPLFWFEEFFELDSDVRDQLSNVLLLIKLINGVPFMIAFTGIILVFASIIKITQRYLLRNNLKGENEIIKNELTIENEKLFVNSEIF